MTGLCPLLMYILQCWPFVLRCVIPVAFISISVQLVAGKSCFVSSAMRLNMSQASPFEGIAYCLIIIFFGLGGADHRNRMLSTIKPSPQDILAQPTYPGPINVHHKDQCIHVNHAVGKLVFSTEVWTQSKARLNNNAVCSFECLDQILEAAGSLPAIFTNVVATSMHSLSMCFLRCVWHALI